jgi:chromosome segregation ATPase
MKYLVLFLILSFVVSAAFIGLVVFLYLKQKGSAGGSTGKFREELELRRKLKDELEGLYAQMADVSSLRKQGRALIGVKESLKTERGRITITQAELETVEARLRELEEIERELAASNLDTQEEINILLKKREALATKNDNLKQQISSSLAQIDTVMGELQMSAEMQEQIGAMKVEIVQTQEKIDSILLQIEQGNEQYFVLKKRYDALDIEYAQLYEKFAAAEEASKDSGG